MDNNRSRLRLDIRVDAIDGLEQPQVIPRINGSVLGLDLSTRDESEQSGLGMDPALLLGRNGLLLPTETELVFPGEQPRMVPVWRCSCGELGCSAIGMRVRRVQDTPTGYDAIVWNDWYRTFDGKTTTPGRIVFDTEHYFAEFIRASSDFSWESAARRAGRLLEGFLETRPEILGTWGLSLVAAKGALFYGEGVIDLWMRSPVDRYRVPFDYADLTVDPAEKAREILDRVAVSNPMEWPETISYDTPHG